MSSTSSASFQGTRPLVRLALRRDRVIVPASLAVFIALAASSATATIGLYPTVASRVQAAAAINNAPALVALYGRLYDPTSIGELAMLKTISFGAAMVAVLAMVLTVRHTRTEEEAGRLELIGAAAVGRRAPLTAALGLAAGTVLVLGLLSAAALVASGLPLAGSVAFGLSWTATGCAFAAVAALAAQLTTSARTANAITGATIGAAYLLRAVGDAAGHAGPQWASWVSPLGWAQQIRPFAGNRWWVLALFVPFTIATAGAAFALNARRDAGAGMLADRPGPATAAAHLRSPVALAWRLHRGLLAAWAAAFVVLGLVLGGIASNVGSFLTSPQARDLITRLGGLHGLTDAFIAAELGFAGVLASAYGIQAAGRLRSEETADHLEPLLATATGRVAWACSHLAFALLGTVALLTATGLGAGVARMAQTGDAAAVGQLVVSALAQVPATWVLTGIVVAAFGVAPRLSAAGWVALVAFVLIGEFGSVLRLAQPILDLSPFAHIPKLPGSKFAPAPLVWLTLLAAGLTVIGLVTFRRRDIG